MGRIGCDMQFMIDSSEQPRRRECPKPGCGHEFCGSCMAEWTHSRPCDNPDCTEGIIETGWFGLGKEKDCPTCDGVGEIDIREHQWKSCGEYAEALITTDRDELQRTRDRDERATREMLARDTKRCPGCNAQIIKNE